MPKLFGVAARRGSVDSASLRLVAPVVVLYGGVIAVIIDSIGADKMAAYRSGSGTDTSEIQFELALQRQDITIALLKQDVQRMLKENTEARAETCSALLKKVMKMERALVEMGGEYVRLREDIDKLMEKKEEKETEDEERKRRAKT